MPDIISRATRRAAREAWVETTLREIETDFDNAGIEIADLPAGMNISGERRILVERYYARSTGPRIETLVASSKHMRAFSVV